MDDPVLLTGGLGFIGSAFARRLVGAGCAIVNLDVGTYAADARRIADLPQARIRTEAINVAGPGLHAVVRRVQPRLVVHFAAESHVTRSERAPALFHRTNVVGTRQILEAAEAAGTELVIHISTDEVYGPCSGGAFKEDDKFPGEGLATSPYARSKAVADDVAMSFARRVPVIVVRPTNCYGPWQHPEKAIARWTTRALRGERIPVWGDGRQTRDWMHVDDVCAGILTIIERGRPGTSYNLGPEENQRSNFDIARMLAVLAGRDHDDVYLTEYDRPNHDRRYAVDSSRARALGWTPERSLEDGLRSTVAWYRDHEQWWKTRLAEAEVLYADHAERKRP